MENIKICKYCNENMKYGLYTQVMSTTTIKDEISINKTIKYLQYGWSCKMKNDDCDIVFDSKDNTINKIIEENAYDKNK